MCEWKSTTLQLLQLTCIVREAKINVKIKFKKMRFKIETENSKMIRVGARYFVHEIHDNCSLKCLFFCFQIQSNLN